MISGPDSHESDDDNAEDADEDRTYRYPEATNIDPPRIDVEIPHVS